MAASTGRNVNYLMKVFSSIQQRQYIHKYRSPNLSWCRISTLFLSQKFCSSFNATVKESTTDLDANGAELIINSTNSGSNDILRGIGKTLAEQKKRSLLEPDQPSNAKILRIAILGTPNAGKSTLTNRLLGWKVASVSKKVHTTRKITLGVLTEDETQLVFLDTPGILHPAQRKKHNLEESLVTDPAKSLLKADMIGVLVDVSNTWSRNELDSRILNLLYLHKHLPSVLILNKVDMVKHKSILLGITRKLAAGYCGGEPLPISTKKSEKQMNLKSLLDGYSEKEREIEGNYDYGEDYENLGLYSDDEYDDSEMYNTPPKISERKIAMFLKANKAKIHDFRNHRDEAKMADNNKKDLSDDVRYRLVQLSVGVDPDVQSVIEKSLESSDTDVEKMRGELKGMTGWPHFSKIFMLSALTGDGMDELKEYFMNESKPGDWHYHSSLVTDQNPQELAQYCVWEKILEYLPKEIPYNMFPRIVQWEIKDEDFLDIVMTVDVDNTRYFRTIIGRNGENIRKISCEAEQEIMNALRCDVRLYIQIRREKNSR